MDHKKDREILRKVGITEAQMNRLSKLRTNLAEEGKVILVKGRWIEDFLDEICTFPNSQHDDQLDAVSLAVQMLQKRKQIAFAF